MVVSCDVKPPNDAKGQCQDLRTKKHQVARGFLDPKKDTDRQNSSPKMEIILGKVSPQGILKLKLKQTSYYLKSKANNAKKNQT